jgi:hypothetical protein
VTDDLAAPTTGAEAVQLGMLLSAIRCVITYVLLPGAAAATGATGSTARLAVGLQVLGAGFAVYGSVRLWRSRHRLRWAYTAVTVVILGMAVAALRSL